MGQGSSSAVRPPTDSFLLVSSVTEGNSDIAALFLKKNPHLLYTSAHDRGTLLHLAAQHGQAKTLQVLVNTVISASLAAANPKAPLAVKILNQQNNKGMTALAVACEGGHDDCVRVLLTGGADAWIADSSGRTAIHFAAQKGRSGCVRLLVEKYTAGLPASYSPDKPDGASPDPTQHELQVAAGECSQDAEASAEAGQASCAPDAQPSTPAAAAVADSAAEAEAVEQEDDAREGEGLASGNGDEGAGPQHKAASHSGEAGDRNEGGGREENGLWAESSVGAVAQPVVVTAVGAGLPQERGPRVLTKVPTERLTASARIANLKDVYGICPLHTAAMGGHLASARILLAAGASVSAQTSSDCFDSFAPCTAGSTPLHLAALRGDHPMVVAMLHQYVATVAQAPECPPPDPRALVDSYGHPPYGLASLRRHHSVLELLDPVNILTDLSLKADPPGDGSDEPRLPVSTAASTSLDPTDPGSPSHHLPAPLLDAATAPRPFACPITGSVMRHPVVASDGFTYERASISDWISKGNTTSPVTGERLTSMALYPNHMLLLAMREWQLHQEATTPRAGSPHSPLRSMSARITA